MAQDSSEKRIMIVTGEASGDMHGAKVVRAVREQAPQAIFFGAGGRQMADAGCEVLVPTEDLAIMGLVEVLDQLPVVWRAFQTLKTRLYASPRPDALVLIDSPEFNLRLAKQAKRAGVPVLYYVSPQVWAWRRGRVKKIARIVDKLAAIFPFEPELYRDLDIDTRYVGHPLLDEFKITRGRDQFLRDFQIDSGKTVVGLFPGSRRNELKYMLATLVDTARLLVTKQPNLHFVVPVAATLDRKRIEKRFSADLPVTFIESDQASIYDTAAACDAVLSVSGTVTLQVALVGSPMAICYKMAPLTYQIGKRLVKVEHVGLANIVAGKEVVREFIQHEATPENLADEVIQILNDHEYATVMRHELAQVKEQLGQPGCSERVAAMLFDLIREKDRSG